MANGLTIYRTCGFILLWHIAEGRVGEVDLSDLPVGLVGHYSDHGPRAPWFSAIYSDALLARDSWQRWKKSLVAMPVAIWHSPEIFLKFLV